MLESGYSQSAVLLGGKDLPAHVTGHEFLPKGKEDIDPYISTRESGIKRILAARSEAVEFEGREAIRKCLTKKLRAYGDPYFEKYQNAQVMMNGRWNGGFRFVGPLRHNGLVEKGPTITKAPKLYSPQSLSVNPT